MVRRAVSVYYSLSCISLCINERRRLAHALVHCSLGAASSQGHQMTRLAAALRVINVYM